MLAAHDQENLVYNHQAGAAVKQQNQGVRQLQPKTPGARYPKTPLKIPLNDENANHGFGGKSAVAGKSRGGNENIMTVGKGGNGLNKANWVTPMEPRTSRAPLGNKTTNAKARTTQTVGVKDIVREIEKSQAKPASTQRPKQRSPKAQAFKLDVLNDQKDPLGDEEEEDVEYCPPRPEDLPYESDVFPDGVITFEALKPENALKGYYDYYHRAVDENGKTRLEREMEKQREDYFRRADEQIKKDMDEMNWNLGLDTDQPHEASKKKQASAPLLPKALGATRKMTQVTSKPPATIASRKAALALSMASKPTNGQPKPSKPVAGHARSASSFIPGRRPLAHAAPSKPAASSEATAALAASRSTLGYTKGRSASSMVHGPNKSVNTARTLSRTLSTASSGSDTTITQERYAQDQAVKSSNDTDLGRLEFLSIFDINEDDDGHLGASPDEIKEDSDDDFQFDVKF